MFLYIHKLLPLPSNFIFIWRIWFSLYVPLDSYLFTERFIHKPCIEIKKNWWFIYLFIIHCHINTILFVTSASFLKTNWTFFYLTSVSLSFLSYCLIPQCNRMILLNLSKKRMTDPTYSKINQLSAFAKSQWKSSCYIWNLGAVSLLEILTKVDNTCYWLTATLLYFNVCSWAEHGTHNTHLFLDSSVYLAHFSSCTQHQYFSLVTSVLLSILRFIKSSIFLNKKQHHIDYLLFLGQ